jgi:hypothetical protein
VGKLLTSAGTVHPPVAAGAADFSSVFASVSGFRPQPATLMNSIPAQAYAINSTKLFLTARSFCEKVSGFQLYHTISEFNPPLSEITT